MPGDVFPLQKAARFMAFQAFSGAQEAFQASHHLLPPKASALLGRKQAAMRRARRLSAMYFTKTEEWLSVEDAVGTVGITARAQRALGEVLYCRLPSVGRRVQVMEPLCSLEATKSVAEVHAPVQGEVLEVNPRRFSRPFES